MRDERPCPYLAPRISYLASGLFSASRRRPRSVLRSRLGAARGEPLREFARHALDHQRGAGLHHPGEPAGNLDLRVDGNDRRARCLPATTWKVIAVFTRVPPWSSLPREETCPIIAVPSSSSATFARKVTWVGPNFTVRVVSYEPSSNRSPSFAPGTQSTTARGSDSTSHTIRGAAGTSTRSLISITMVDGGSVWGSNLYL